MAGLPETVIERANQILDIYTKDPPKNESKIKNESILKSIEDYETINNWKKQIDSIDINNTTPYQALEILVRLKEKKWSLKFYFISLL